MMDEIRNYLFSIICASLICSIAVAVVGKDTSFGKVVKLLTGLILSVVVLAPMVTIRVDDIALYFESLQLNADDAVQEGIAFADTQNQVLIKEKTKTYIMEKAASLGADLEIDIELSDEYPQKPTKVFLSGMVSPYVKSILVNDIRQNLGIPEEEQFWN